MTAPIPLERGAVNTTSFNYFENRFLNDVKLKTYNMIELINIPKLTTPIPIPIQTPITNEIAKTRIEAISVKCVVLNEFF